MLAFDSLGKEEMVDAYLSNVTKFKNIVTSNGGHLIVGIQGYGKERIQEAPHVLYEEVIKLYDELKLAVSGDDTFIDFTQIDGMIYVDSVHTEDVSSLKIAEYYASVIRNYLNT